MNILITGGAGYVGTELAHAVENFSDANIIIYDNLSRDNYNLFLEGSFNSDRVKFINGDILDTRKLSKVLEDVDMVVHLAAKVTTPFSGQSLHQYEQVNHWGTSEVVYHAEQSERVKKFIYLSSASVYGLGVNKQVDETSEPAPTSHYGLSKLRGESEVKLLSDTINTSIIRSANVFGYSRSMRFDSVVNKFMFEAHFNNKIKVYGDGHQERPFISIDFLVKKLVKVIFESDSKPLKNLVEFNFSILDVIQEGILKLYPDTEIIFIGQELPVKGLRISAEQDDINLQDSDRFLNYLNSFKSKFTF